MQTRNCFSSKLSRNLPNEKLVPDIFSSSLTSHRRLTVSPSDLNIGFWQILRNCPTRSQDAYVMSAANIHSTSCQPPVFFNPSSVNQGILEWLEGVHHSQDTDVEEWAYLDTLRTLEKNFSNALRQENLHSWIHWIKMR